VTYTDGKSHPERYYPVLCFFWFLFLRISFLYKGFNFVSYLKRIVYVELFVFVSLKKLGVSCFFGLGLFVCRIHICVF
jgi:hypothetical protein